jgi:sulfatase modifying factor 1
MKTIRIAMLLTFTALLTSRGEDARFFRIAGPVPTAITAFSADGYVTWTNTLTNATFTVQTASLPFGPSNWVDYIQVPATNPITMHRLFDPSQPAGMMLIPAGSFTMGNCMETNEATAFELPLHSVYVSAFHLDQHEVTKALWDEVFNWATNHGYSFEHGAQGKTNNHPVVWATWYDAVKWCNARSEMEGRMPAYYTSASQDVVYRTGQLDLENDWVNWNAGYRVPTEAEWEKAARGGLAGKRFPWGDTITHSRANYVASSNYGYDQSPTFGLHPLFNDGVSPRTSPVEFFPPNGYLLSDMSGNASEWCWDWANVYPSEMLVDPRGPLSGPGRIWRGGCHADFAYQCRTSFRGYFSPTIQDFRIGFRTVLPTYQ